MQKACLLQSVMNYEYHSVYPTTIPKHYNVPAKSQVTPKKNQVKDTKQLNSKKTDHKKKDKPPLKDTKSNNRETKKFTKKKSDRSTRANSKKINQMVSLIHEEMIPVSVHKKIVYLGVYKANPDEYIEKYGGGIEKNDDTLRKKISFSTTNGLETSEFNSSEEELSGFSIPSQKTSGKNTPFLVRNATPKLLGADMKPLVWNKKKIVPESPVETVDSLLDQIAISTQMEIKTQTAPVEKRNKAIKEKAKPTQTFNGYSNLLEGNLMSALSKSESETSIQRVLKQLNMHLKEKKHALTLSGVKKNNS